MLCTLSLFVSSSMREFANVGPPCRAAAALPCLLSCCSRSRIRSMYMFLSCLTRPLPMWVGTRVVLIAKYTGTVLECNGGRSVHSRVDLWKIYAEGTVFAAFAKQISTQTSSGSREQIFGPDYVKQILFASVSYYYLLNSLLFDTIVKEV